MDLPNPPSSPDAGAHSGFGILSSVFAAAAAAVLFVSLKMMVGSAFSVTQPVTVKGAATIVSVMGLGVSGIILVFGFALGIAGIMQRDRKPLFAIAGTAANSSLLMTLLILSVVGMAAVKQGAQVKLDAAARPAPQPVAVSQSGGGPRSPAYADEMERHGSAAALAGYERVLVADLVSDPARYDSHKVAFTGFFAGTQVDSFIVFGKWGGGGTVVIDGSALAPDKQKALTLSLDGFHKVFVRGVFKTSIKKPMKDGIRAGFFGMGARDQMVAEEVVDLGKVDYPTEDR